MGTDFSDVHISLPRDVKAGGLFPPSAPHLPIGSVPASEINVAKLAKGRKWRRNLDTNVCLTGDFYPRPLHCQLSTLTALAHPSNLWLTSAMYVGLCVFV